MKKLRLLKEAHKQTMKKFEISEKDDDGITQKDIDKAIERLESFYRNSTKQTKNEKSVVKKIKDDGRHLTILFKPEPHNPFDQIREGKPIEIKTIFHAVEVEIKDHFGGTFTCEYHIRETIQGILDHLPSFYPKYSKAEIEKLAKQFEKDYEKTKAILAHSIAQQIFELKGTVGGFFHSHLELTLKTVLEDLIVDAELAGLKKFDYQLSHASDYEKFQKKYLQLRRNRVKIIKDKGRPKGSKSIDETEFYQIIVKIYGFIEEIKN